MTTHWPRSDGTGYLAKAGMPPAHSAMVANNAGRVFAKHVLTTERPPTLGKLVAGLFKRRA